MKKIMLLATLLAFSGCLVACGDTESPTYDPSYVDPIGEVGQPTEEELGTLRQPLYVETGYGMYDSDNAHLGRCPVGGADPYHSCFVPRDKKVRLKYTGTNDRADAFSLSIAFDRAVANVCADLNSVGWDCAKTTGSSNEKVFNSTDPGLNGALGIMYQKPWKNSAGSDWAGYTAGGGRYAWVNGCDIHLNKAAIANEASDTGRQMIVAQNVIYHEIMHCQMLGHKAVSGNIMHPNNQSSTSVLRADGWDMTLFYTYSP